MEVKLHSADLQNLNVLREKLQQTISENTELKTLKEKYEMENSGQLCSKSVLRNFEQCIKSVQVLQIGRSWLAVIPQFSQEYRQQFFTSLLSCLLLVTILVWPSPKKFKQPTLIVIIPYVQNCSPTLPSCNLKYFPMWLFVYLTFSYTSPVC